MTSIAAGRTRSRRAPGRLTPSPRRLLAPQVTSYAVVPNAGDDTASVIDTRTRTVRPTPIAVGAVPEAAAWTPMAAFTYVTNPFDGTVSVITSRPTYLLGELCPSAVFPAGIVARRTGSSLYVANSGSDTISVLDAAQRRALALAARSPSLADPLA